MPYEDELTVDDRTNANGQPSAQLQDCTALLELQDTNVAGRLDRDMRGRSCCLCVLLLAVITAL